eukprot:1392814-Amorphochlora_amoeboformis.AAC.1
MAASIIYTVGVRVRVRVRVRVKVRVGARDGVRNGKLSEFDSFKIFPRIRGCVGLTGRLLI